MEKTFSAEDQLRFAKLSGDWNPMHTDPVAARRTQAGALVVHGIHIALTGLEFVAEEHPSLPPIASLKVTFGKFVYVGDTVEYRAIKKSDHGIVVEAFVDGVVISQIAVVFGEPSVANFDLSPIGGPVLRPEAPIDLTFEQMDKRTGHLCAPATLTEVVSAFSAASRAWSAERIFAMLCTTTLVGMVCPGLHSIFGGLTLRADDTTPEGDELSYRVTATDSRFRMVRMQVRGSGVWGTIDSFARMPSIAQPSMQDLAGLCKPDEFAGSTVLIAGGSRGLGELTARLLALGGADVIVTYATGLTDAEALADSVRSWGGRCGVVKYNFHSPAAEQVTALPGQPTHLYYFATPLIFRRKAKLFTAERYAEFQACYVSGFYDLFTTLSENAPGGLTAFYPSSVFVEDRPRDLTEYAMAKAAGEVLCSDINAILSNGRVVVNRLPRMLTDQTATITPTEMPDPVEVMLPIIRNVQR
jgi:hypothetical protein